MKILLFFLLFTACAIRVNSQSTLPLRADTVVIEKVGGNANFKLKDDRRDSVGGILTNIGGGVYKGKIPRRIGDSLYIGNAVIFVGGGALNNIGTGYALVATPGGNIKRLNPGYGIDMDSTTTANTITIKADTTELVTPSDLNDAVAGAGGSVLYTNTVFVDSAYGSDITGQIDRADKPFATLDAALDAGVSVPALHVKIGFGSYAKPTPAKMRNYLWIEGSGKPGHNGIVSMIGYADFSNTAPTKLTGGTIILGKIQSIDHSFVKISDLGVDQGSAYVAGGGTENDGIGIGSLTTTTPFPLMQGIEIDNVICLLKDPTSAFHGIVVENHIGFRINNCDVIFGTHGIVSKGMGGTITNCKVSDCATDAFIIKSDSYAYSWATQLSDFECASIFSTSCGGVYVLASTGPAHGGIKISNGTIRQCTYGVLAIGSNDALTVVDVKVQGGSGIGFNFDAVSFVQVINCFARGTSGDGFHVNAATTGHMLISNCMAVGNGGDGFDLSTNPGSIEVENCSANSNSGFGFEFGNNVYVNTITYTSNGAGNVNGVPTYQLPYTTRANTFIQRNIFNGSEVQIGSGTDQGAYTLQNTGGFYQNGIVSLSLGSDANYDIYYRNSSGLLTPLAAATDGYVLTTHSTSSAPTWEAPAGGGDGIYGGSGTLPSPVTISTAGNTLEVTGSNDSETSFSVTNSGTTAANAIAGNVTGSTGAGVTGTSTAGNGVVGTSSSNYGVVGTSTTGAAFRGQINPASDNAIENGMSILRTTSAGAGANGLGAAIQYELETATNGTSQTAGRIAFVWSDATNASRTSRFEIYGVNNTTLARKAALAGNGQWTWDGYGAGTHTGTPTGSLQTTSAGAIIEGPALAAGLYTPTLTAVTNTSSPLLDGARYTRIGNIVTFSFRFSVTTTTGASVSAVRVTLPVGSSFSNVNQAAGTCSGSLGYVDADAANDELTVNWISGISGSETIVVTGQYTIL